MTNPPISRLPDILHLLREILPLGGFLIPLAVAVRYGYDPQITQQWFSQLETWGILFTTQIDYGGQQITTYGITPRGVRLLRNLDAIATIETPSLASVRIADDIAIYGS